MTIARNTEPSSSRHVGLLADVSRASNVVAPLWPLTSFVAVNPLGGFQHLPFDEATAAARRWLGARTHLTLAEFRADHERGRTADSDLDRAIMAAVPTLVAAGQEVRVAERSVTPLDVVRLDLLHGPESPRPVAERTAGQRLDPPLTDDTSRSIDALVAAWCAVHVDEAVARWRHPEPQRGLYGAWRRLAPHDRRLRRLTGRAGRDWIARAPERAEAALDHALGALGVDDERRVDELRAQLARLPGWAGYAHWYDEWASPDHAGAAFRMVELLALRATIEAAVVVGGRGRGPGPRADEQAEPDASLDARVAAVLDALAVAAEGDPLVVTAVRSALEQVPDERRAAIWLAAQEDNFRDRLLTKMSRLDPGAADQRPAAQAAFCIDVRSEGLRRHLEAQGAYETLGFAGFFGVPIRWRPLGSPVAEARAPVLVSPRHEVAERPEPGADDASAHLRRRRAAGGAVEAFHTAKNGPGSPFALAEAAGWVAGPLAAVRTLRPPRADRTAGSAARPRTAPVVAAEGDDRSGFSLHERTLFAEAILTTMGLTRRFAPLVLLCGHGSRTVNNPHASSLDCGACGGAPGGASARVAAAILNDPEVRAALAERGLTLPDDTWFVAGEHDTASDVVTVLDRELVPSEHLDGLQELERALDAAGERHAEERARRLPGDPAQVRHRGADWAQVRPEWGLAGNAAFVVGPRSVTAGLDLAGRVFLHSYDPEADVDGVALETILTAPLVVGQWISAQYYFSTVDPEVFGAGDKTLHNPVGGVGVTLGEGGDLQVGLPTQSVAVGDRRMHEPLRLLAVVQAPLERIEAIIQRNDVLRELIGGSWVHVAGRSHGSEPWSVRAPGGTWSTWWPTDDTLDPTDVSLEVP